MRLAMTVQKYACTVLNGLERAPKMWGGESAIELQYLLALEFLAISVGKTTDFVRERYAKVLESVPGPSNLPLASRELCAEDIIKLMKPIRSDIERP